MRLSARENTPRKEQPGQTLRIRPSVSSMAGVRICGQRQIQRGVRRVGWCVVRMRVWCGEFRGSDAERPLSFSRRGVIPLRSSAEEMKTYTRISAHQPRQSRAQRGGAEASERTSKENSLQQQLGAPKQCCASSALHTYRVAPSASLTSMNTDGPHTQLW